MQRLSFGVFGVLGLAFAATGCKEDVSSADIRTSGITATIEVLAKNDTDAVVTVDLAVGGTNGTLVVLDNGDRLEAKLGDQVKSLTTVSTGKYRTTFSGTKEGDEISVAFVRTEADESALDNKVTIPSPFTLTGPESGKSRANDDLTATWTPSGKGDPFTLGFAGSCIFDDTIDVAGDPGTQTIGKGTLDSTGGDKPTECDISLTAQRKRRGTTDIKLESESSAVAIHERSASFTSKP